VALLAATLGQSFVASTHAFAETILPRLLKQTLIKISVVNSGADRCIRTLLVSTAIGNPKIVAYLVEQTQSKSSIHRKLSLDYLCIVYACWRPDVLDKGVLSVISTALLSGLNDADPSARRSARMLFWCLHEREDSKKQKIWRGSLETNLMKESTITEATMKNINNEKAHLSSELAELLELVKSPKTVQNVRIKKVDSSVAVVCDDEQMVAERLVGTERLLPRRSLAAEKAANFAKDSIEPMRSVTAATDDSKYSTRISKSSLASSGALRIAVSAVSEGIGTSTSRSGVGKTIGSTPQVSSVDDEPIDEFAGLSDDFSSFDTKSRPSIGSTPRRSLLSGSGPLRVAVGAGSSTAASASATTIGAQPDVGNNGRLLGSGARRIVNSIQTQQAMQKSLSSTLPSSQAESISSDVLSAVLSPKHPKISLRQAEPRLIPTEATEGDASISGIDSCLTRLAPEPTQATGTAHKDGSRSAVDSPTGLEPNSRIFPMSLDDMKEKAGDNLWNVRLEVFESIHQEMESRSMGSVEMSNVRMDAFVELCIAHAGDIHAKVAVECMQTLGLCVERLSDSLSNKLGPLCICLFQRLTDRRASIQSSAQQLLNTIRETFDPALLLQSLSPKVAEVPDRLRTALFQYLGAIVAHCQVYLCVPQQCNMLLQRLANVLGLGSKPSNTLLLAGKRLLELIYRTAPQVALLCYNNAPMTNICCVISIHHPFLWCRS
jgi:hypothetical protein